MKLRSTIESVRAELRRQTLSPLRLRRQVFSPKREFRRIDRNIRRVLADPGLELSVWQSYQPVLVELLRRLERPRVLELGVGYGSTPIVLELSESSVSLDTDREWYARFARFDRPQHRVLHWTDYDASAWNCPYFDEQWDVAFVDNSPHTTRQGNVLRLADRARFIVCHDTEECYKPAGSSYRWDFSGFRHVWTYTRFDNFTTVVSNVEPIPLDHLGGLGGQPRWLG